MDTVTRNRKWCRVGNVCTAVEHVIGRHDWVVRIDGSKSGRHSAFVPAVVSGSSGKRSCGDRRRDVDGSYVGHGVLSAVGISYPYVGSTAVCLNEKHAVGCLVPVRLELTDTRR